MSSRSGVRWKPILAAAAAAVGVAALGASATELGPWYQSLVKPSWREQGLYSTVRMMDCQSGPAELSSACMTRLRSIRSPVDDSNAITASPERATEIGGSA